MGFYKNYIMENTKKIVCGFFFISFIISCGSSIRNKIYIKKKDKHVFFKHFTFNEQGNQDGSFKQSDSIFFSKVIFENQNILNENIIDTESFDALYNDINDREKVKNDYYLRGDDYYFKDNKYVYIYVDDVTQFIKPKFFIAGKINDYNILGGSYLKVGNKIYCKGVEIENVDIKTFKIAKMRLKYSEWFQTIGFDKNAFYIENRKEDKSKLNLYKNYISEIDVDSLQKAYFSK